MENSNKLPAICRNCKYRKSSKYESFYNGNSKNDSMCTYIIETGEKRGCIPTDTECEKFSPRENAKKSKMKSKYRKTII